MLVILNGAPKGGSTWLVQIIKATNFFNEIPEEFKEEGWTNSSLSERKLSAFLRAYNIEVSNFYCKQHWHGKQEYQDLLNNPHIKMVNIIRDIRDVIVSRYFHDLRLNLVEDNGKNINDYYWNRGRKLMMEYMNYHVFWHDNLSVEFQPFLCSYEMLHHDFISHTNKMLEYLGESFVPQESRLKQIQGETSFSNKKDKGQGKFFRKGVVGDWQNHLSKIIIEDLERLAEETGYLQVKRKMLENFGLEILKETDFGIS